MSESVVKASLCIDRRLLSEVERLRNFENSALSQVSHVVYLIGLGRKLYYNLSIIDRSYGVGNLEKEFLKNYPKITIQGSQRIEYRASSSWLNDLSMIEINKFIFFGLKKLQSEVSLNK